MAVTVKGKEGDKPEGKTDEKATTETKPEGASVASTETKADEGTVAQEVVEPKPEEEIFLKLALGSTYIHPDGKVYRAGSIYRMSKAAALDLLRVRNDASAPYFVRTKNPAVVRTSVAGQAVEASTVDQPDQVPESDEELLTHEEDDLLDTGAMALKDADGNPAGTVTV